MEKNGFIPISNKKALNLPWHFKFKKKTYNSGTQCLKLHLPIPLSESCLPNYDVFSTIKELQASAFQT